ncbi:hypothetical protein N7489_003929 [Penicillium chrysogenum]|uniref:Uncharacterized protein n=1 Tax=Penicillium chrysogenum TaxID=5076 RepID=A0ABQ8WSY2_PENCH|nr:uncharacterized protein N7489_003929 [Penicillium chrysogenum]KAJ5243833.1 hypothetical protein N7489_003929 [Penicillium chrysogenum]KAJ5275555.1 hypothetical protein N7505_004100 [Penicillium chrysogenum]KAJ5286023.1 hypothetical protein N7524_001329 [Penicillium chrysogenum]KAJ6140913.1 hypothetical protein N7497_011806 [Penicillium chrysogenum]
MSPMIQGQRRFVQRGHQPWDPAAACQRSDGRRLCSAGRAGAKLWECCYVKLVVESVTGGGCRRGLSTAL